MLWNVFRDWLDGSGYITAITNSGISAGGLIGDHHICRYGNIHQVSEAALYVLRKKAPVCKMIAKEPHPSAL